MCSQSKFWGDGIIETGLFVIKPDGMKIYGEKYFQDILLKESIEIIRVKKSYCNCNIINEYFISPYGKEYYDYFTSGEIEAMLVYGKNVTYKLLSIKRKIREENNCQNSMENLIHSADNPLELVKQCLFFWGDEILDEIKYFADLHKINVNKNYYIFTNFEQDFQEKVIKSCIYINKRLLDIYIFHPKEFLELEKGILATKKEVDEIHKKHGIIILDCLEYDYFTVETVETLRNFGIDGVKVFDHRYSIKELEHLLYLVKYKFKLLCLGWSNIYGKIGVDEMCCYEIKKNNYSIIQYCEKHAQFYPVNIYFAKGKVIKEYSAFAYKNLKCIENILKKCKSNTLEKIYVEDDKCITIQRQIIVSEHILCPEEIGEKMFRLHMNLSHDSNYYPERYMLDFFIDIVELLYKNFRIPQLNIIQKFMIKYDKEKLFGKHGGIHGDFHLLNVLNNGRNIIDYDMVGYGCFGIDIITMFNSLRNHKLINNFYQGYIRLKPQFFSIDELCLCVIHVRLLCICSNLLKYARGECIWLESYIAETAYLCEKIIKNKFMVLKKMYGKVIFSMIREVT